MLRLRPHTCLRVSRAPSPLSLVLAGIVAAGSLAFVACSKESAPSSPSASEAAAASVGAAPGAAAGGGKVAFLLSTLQEERYQKDKAYFEAKAKALGLSAFTLSADNDNARQLGQVEDALSRGAKVLVIQPTDTSAASAYVDKAHKKGAKVVAYDRLIKGDALDFYVAHDSFEVGRLEAEAAVKATGGKGNYVLLQGQSGHSVASEIARGYQRVLKPYLDKGDIKIVVEKNHDAWSPEQALKTMEDALAKSKGDLQAVLANNSGMARGAVQALSAAGKKGVFVAGADADAANVNYVCDGKQSVEVLKDIRPLAEKAAEVAKALLGGETVQGTTTESTGKVPVAAVAVHLVTKDTVKPLLLDSGFHKAGELSACAAK